LDERGSSWFVPLRLSRFEVSSVKPSNADASSSAGIKTGHGRLDAYNVTLKRCIMGAYGCFK
jgi:uncharacterized protein (TIGR03435 family)